MLTLAQQGYADYDGKYLFAGGQINTKPVTALQLTDLTAGPPISSFFQNDQYKAKAKLDAILMTHLQQQNVKGMKTDGGTLSLLDKTSFSVEDGSAFRDYVIGCQLWDLVDFTPDKSAVEAWLEKYKQLPPGVKMSTFQSLGVRRPSEK